MSSDMSELEAAVIEKFWKHVEKTSYCWNWIGTKSKGLPYVIVGTAPNKKQGSAKRISLMIAGKDVPNNEIVVSTCRNVLCVNPDHLVIGSELRFWARVHKLQEPDGCWVWIGGSYRNGYGSFTAYENGQKVHYRAHCYSWKLFTGRPILKGMVVCHKCDHPYCVNPYHLFLGEHQDNSDDKVSKGRQTKGVDCHDAVFDPTKVKEIRELFKSGTDRAQLSRIYKVSWGTIDKIIKGKTWKHVT